MPAPVTTPLRVGLAGLGTVGQGVLELLERNGALIARRAGRPIIVTRVASRRLRPDARLGSAQDFCARLAQHGVAAIGMGPSRVRMVTHLDVRAADIDRAAAAIALAAGKA